MKICLINNLYEPLARGGAEKVAQTIAAGLFNDGHDVFIITTKPRSENLKSKIGNLNVYYINSLYYNLHKFPGFLRLFWHLWNIFNIISYFEIKKILRAEKCDAVITNNLMGIGYLTPLAINNLKISHLHIAHDIQLIHPSGVIYYGRERIINGLFAKIYGFMCRRLFARTPAVIFPSYWLKDLYANKKFFTKSKNIVLPNPVDNAPNPAGERAGNFKFLFLGQIEKHKGVFLLIEAFNKIKKIYPEVELLMAGSGSQMKAAQTRAGENKNIKFLGWKGDDEVNKLLYSCDSLVYPSLVYENCPNAIQRALAAGLPVLGAQMGGISELLNQNAGVLFKPADANDLAVKMAWLIENRNDLDNIIEAGKKQASFFKIENYIKKLESLLKL